jgi:hypothetical protein
MTSRYRVEYHLKSHRRDELIEWIKGLLVVPFVLVRELPSTIDNVASQESIVKDRYASVFSDVEGLIEDHSIHFLGFWADNSCASREGHTYAVKVEDVGSYNRSVLHAIASQKGVPHNGTSTSHLATSFRRPFI